MVAVLTVLQQPLAEDPSDRSNTQEAELENEAEQENEAEINQAAVSRM